MNLLFENTIECGAEFSPCREYRYALWRIWDKSLPLIMFIGLNPSTANETEPDQTIHSVYRISKRLGYGGFYMMNCFPHISTNPENLFLSTQHAFFNDQWLTKVAAMCEEIVFAWGGFEIVKHSGRDQELCKMFPHAKALIINKDGSPHHPLYIPKSVTLKYFPK